jgi:DNA-binding CsgD family transcriptional regulator
MVRLVQALQARMLAARTVDEVCSLFLELFMPLFDASGVRIAFTASIQSLALEGASPQGRCAGVHVALQKLAVPLQRDGQLFGEIALYFPEGHPALDAPNHALLDFAAGFLCNAVAGRVAAESRIVHLTKTERKVLGLLDRPTSQILDELGISEATLRTHLKHLYRKLGVSSRREALRFLEADRERLSRFHA